MAIRLPELNYYKIALSEKYLILKNYSNQLNKKKLLRCIHEKYRWIVQNIIEQ